MMANGIVPAKRLRTILEGFPRKRIMVLGDLMLDQFIRGKVSRISPEAPVPVVQVSSENSVPGGAGNVCNNLAALGAGVCVISIVGSDSAGHQLLTHLKARNVMTEGILVDQDRPTTQKCRVVAEHQQVVRFDREASAPVSQKLQSRLIAAIESAVASCQAIVISDYGKGVITPAVLQKAISAAHRAKIPITVDPKVEHFKRYRGVDCITPNLQEAFAGMHMLLKDNEDAIEDLGRRILKTLRAASVLITRGEKGMSLFESRSPRTIHIPSQAREVFDVTGAGDTVISVLTLALACKGNLKEAAVLSNKAAGIVVGKLGTATVTVPEIQETLS